MFIPNQPDEFQQMVAQGQPGNQPMVGPQGTVNQGGLLSQNPMLGAWQSSPAVQGLLSAMNPTPQYHQRNRSRVMPAMQQLSQTPMGMFNRMAGGLNSLYDLPPTMYSEPYQEPPAQEVEPQPTFAGEYDAWQRSQIPTGEGGSIPINQLSYGEWMAQKPQRDLMTEHLSSMFFGQ
jgi:hypothetical protein